MERLLFIDDDLEILRINKLYFEDVGFIIDAAANADEALDYLDKTHYHCVILDIQMDGQNGFTLCSSIKEMVDIPVIFLTNYTDDGSLDEGFRRGGDDYITKPCRLKELELRIRARIRSSSVHKIADHSQTTSGLSIFPDEKQAYINNISLKLTANEFEILQFLMDHKGIPCRQETIYEALWGEKYNSHSIQVLILRIRKKIMALSPEKEYIKTQWGRGYFYTE